MDSPYLDTPQPAVLSHARSEVGEDAPAAEMTEGATQAGSVLIASFGDPVAVDYASFVSKCSRADAIVIADENIRGLTDASTRSMAIDDLRSSPDTATQDGRVESLVLFINSRMSARDPRELDDTLAMARRLRIRSVVIVSTFRVHLDDFDAIKVENDVVARVTSLFVRMVVFRPGHVLSPHSPTQEVISRLAPLFPLAPRRLRTCFLDGYELFTAIESQRLEMADRGKFCESGGRAEKTSTLPGHCRSVGNKNRVYTILGENRPWREMLVRYRRAGRGQALLTAVSTLCSWLMFGQVLALIFVWLARRSPRVRQWNVQMLFPGSLRELLSLCHRGNIDHVKVVGYNNGVAHFGHRHPGKTIVSTVRRCRTAFAGPHTLKADCGVTIRRALDFLADSDQDLYVVPNYSYVCLGTAFFVPIHGSAVDYSTVADTICRVVLYDPDCNQIISATRDDAAFREHVYNQQSRAVLLRLYILAKKKSRYFVSRETLESPTAASLLAALNDQRATNVEIRQAHAASGRVTIARYYTDLGETDSPALELPRDALGRLWDRLEENPVTSYLMHALSRHVAWHTELFFTPEQFDVFWQTHSQLPLRKIQLRYLRRDGLPHSPCRDDDCVSADLFMFRRNRHRFFEYLKTTFSTVRTNPGKHSH
jgi:hypothetical protein